MEQVLKENIIQYYQKKQLSDKKHPMTFSQKKRGEYSGFSNQETPCHQKRGGYPCFKDMGGGELLFDGWSFNSETNEFNDKSLYGNELMLLSFERFAK